MTAQVRPLPYRDLPLVREDRRLNQFVDAIATALKSWPTLSVGVTITDLDTFDHEYFIRLMGKTNDERVEWMHRSLAQRGVPARVRVRRKEIVATVDGGAR